MSSCSLFSMSLFDAMVEENNYSINTELLKSIIPEYTEDTSGIWYPIIIKNKDSKSEYGAGLFNPQNIDDTKISACNCNALTRNIARNTVLAFEVAEEPEDGVYCEYCQKLNQNNKMACKVNVNYNPISPYGEPDVIEWPIASLTPVPIGSGEVYQVPCCQGGCDTRMLTDDITPKIPYLSNFYTDKFYDFKYLKQFPSIENPGLGFERFITYKGNTKGLTIDNASCHIDWILKPRLGELQPQNNETYHKNLYIHQKSYSRYLNTNKTCGNFILQQVNAPTEISEWQSGNMPLLSGLNLHLPVASSVKIENLLPPVEKFTIPYGIKDDTHYNIFLKITKSNNNKVGSFWKWNYTSGLLGWYRYYDKDREKDTRIIPGVDLYISDGDVFFAKNDGPEPLAGSIPAAESCKFQICPSGLKFTNYQTTSTTGTVTIVPSGSEFIYISSNLYNKTYYYMNKLIGLYKKIDDTKLYNDILNQAAILATAPQYDGISIDLFQYPTEAQYNSENIEEFLELIGKLDPISYNRYGFKNLKDKLNDWLDNEIDSKRDEYLRLINLNRRITDKNMVSYNDMNMISTTGQLVKTLTNKYGVYVWIPPDTESTITINKPVQAHAYLDVDYEPVIKLSDTRCATSTSLRNIDCSTVLRGRTKVFGYDQQFSIGESILKATIIDQEKVYSATCVGSPPRAQIDEVASIMSVSFRDHEVYSRSYGSYQTSFSDIYSRFPSVSSTIDTTFTNISDEQDSWGDTNVFTLQKDKQFRLNRKYNGFAACPGIELVGFHEDGGFYYESNLLSRYNNSGTVGFLKNWRPPRAKNNVELKFQTYDIGIKLYNVNAEMLRKGDKLNCKTFPLDQPCRCWGLNKIDNYPFKCSENLIYETPDLFTPYLSTQNIPLLSYGGYTTEKLNSLIGEFRIPGHPDCGSVLPTINKVSDPESSNGCRERATITLPNYVASSWTIQLPNFDMNNSLIWVTEKDSLSFIGNRTQNRVLVDGNEIYPNAPQPLQLSSNTLNIKIYNQFLSNVTPTEDSYIYHPNLYSCSLNKIDINNSARSDIPSYVDLEFVRLPSQSVLNIKMPSIKSLGKLKKSFFDPNKGLQIKSDARGSALSLDKYNGLFNFDYGQKLFNNSTGEYHPISPEDFSLSGSINISQLTQTLKFINTKEDNKKLRLYLKLNDLWYEYEDHRTFGYYNTQDNQQYCGWPTFFAQSNLNTDYAFGPFVPAIPKVPLELLYSTNAQTFQNLIFNDDTSDSPEIPSALVFFRNPKNPKQLLVKGSRAYFMFPNITGAQLPYNNYIINNNEYLIINAMHEDKVMYLDQKYGKYYPANASEINLIPLELYSVSNEDLDTYRRTTKLSDYKKDFFSIDHNILKSNKLLKKSLIVNSDTFAKTDINNILVDKYNNIYTVLEMEKDHPHTNGYIYLLDKENQSITNLTAFPTVKAFNINNSPEELKYKEWLFFGEKKTKDTNYNNKWGDLLYANNTAEILNNQPYQNSINSVHGPFLYDNIFNYIIINNFMISHQITDENTANTYNQFPINLYIKNTGSEGVVSFDSPLISYYIHQPFSNGSSAEKYKKSMDKYNLLKNQDPVIDINIYETGLNGVQDRAFHKAKIKEYSDYGMGNSGIMCISGIYRPYNMMPKTIFSDKFDFFINLNSNFNLKPCPVKEEGFFSRSFVVSDTYNVYNSLEIVNDINTSESRLCSNVIIPQFNNFSFDDNSTYFDWTKFNKKTIKGPPYAFFPIYCDKDFYAECGSTNVCGISMVGNSKVSAKYTSYEYKYKQIFDLAQQDDIDYAISIDAGLYCPLFLSGEPPYIVRSDPPGQYNYFKGNFNEPGVSDDPSNDPCIVTNQSLPPLERPLSVWDNLYQQPLFDNIVDSLDVDHWANEILFRSIYGSKQPINISNISSYSPNKKYEDILKTLVNNPTNSIATIYDNIPYDYDISSVSPNFQLQGAIKIYGAAAVGDTVQITFNDTIFNITIKDNGNDVYAECAEIDAKGLIAEKMTPTTTLYVREAGTVSSVPGAEETVLSTCRSPLSYSVGASCVAVGGGGGYTLNYYDLQPPGNHCFGKFGDFDQVYPDKEGTAEPEAIGGYIVYPPATRAYVGECSALAWEPNNPASPYSAKLDKYAKFKAVNIQPIDPSPPIDCQGYSYSVCRNKKDCCGGDTKIIKTVSYRIRDCHYDFTMYGVVTKSINNITQVVLGDPPTIGACGDPYPSNAFSSKEYLATIQNGGAFCCDCSNPDGNYGWGNGPPATCPNGPPGSPEYIVRGAYERTQGCCGDFCQGILGTARDYNLRATYTYNCNESPSVIANSIPGTNYEVVESTTYSESSTYAPACSRTICTFIYDNNQIKLYLGIAKTRNGVEVYNGGNCINLSTSSCPSIKVSLPNNTYGIDDTSSSSCTNCSTDPKQIKIINNPVWDSEIIDMYCLLGTLVTSNTANPPNWTHGYVCLPRNESSQPIGPNGPLYGEELDKFLLVTNDSRGRVCGKKAKGNCTEFYHFIGSPYEENPSESPSSLCDRQIVISNAYYIGTPDWMTYEGVIDALVENWSAKMEEVYRNKHYCTNNYDFRIDQLIEGAVPGTCEFKTETITYSTKGYQLCVKKEDDNTVPTISQKSGSVTVRVAYMKYKYKRPKNIIDTLTGGNESHCHTYFSAAGTNGCRPDYFFGNIKEQLKSTEKQNNNCASAPNCYDKTRPCDPGNACCRVDRYGNSYLI